MATINKPDTTFYFNGYYTSSLEQVKESRKPTPSFENRAKWLLVLQLDKHIQKIVIKEYLHYSVHCSSHVSGAHRSHGHICPH
jgi:hypothetical protein